LPNSIGPAPGVRPAGGLQRHQRYRYAVTPKTNQKPTLTPYTPTIFGTLTTYSRGEQLLGGDQQL